MNGADLLVTELQKKGVGFVATLCGHGLDDLDDACDRAGMRLVDVRNEQAAGLPRNWVGSTTRGWRKPLAPGALALNAPARSCPR